jgi:hypothetical protein
LGFGVVLFADVVLLSSGMVDFGVVWFAVMHVRKTTTFWSDSKTDKFALKKKKKVT